MSPNRFIAWNISSGSMISRRTNDWIWWPSIWRARPLLGFRCGRDSNLWLIGLPSPLPCKCNSGPRAYGLDDALLLDCFVGGLHPELKREVKARSPIYLLQAVSLAKLFDEKFLPHTQRWRSAVAQTQQPAARPTTALAPKPLTTVSPTQPPPQNPPLLPTLPKPNTLRKLTPMEIQFRREKGICFTYDERYSPSHKCASKHYFLIQTVEEVPTNRDSVIEIPEVDQILPVLAEDRVEPLHLSYNAMAGIPARRSIRFRGLVHGRDIRILIDGGSSDNFIHSALVRRLAVPVHHSPRFKVEVGNGALLQCEGEDHLLLISAFVLPIASEEMVLGDIWLETLDTHLVNYREKFITFMVGAEMVTLQGEKDANPAPAQFHQLRCLHITDEIMEMLCWVSEAFQNYRFGVEVIDVVDGGVGKRHNAFIGVNWCNTNLSHGHQRFEVIVVVVERGANVVLINHHVRLLLKKVVSLNILGLKVWEIELSIMAVKLTRRSIVSQGGFMGRIERPKPDTRTTSWFANLGNPFAPNPLPYTFVGACCILRASFSPHTTLS
ncbi:hypothetical protein Ahy_A06g026281 [Arachis hypogaea]|uniref:Uncharacterized protein n=1 Tax=Arachis hypogaea TaxID=3818 RepID=A0A445CK05_ARAHY|nr:hypothetical protein Ahy_A06g026281 [Arachis hypogaea]